MKTYFSVRHGQALVEGKMPVRFSVPCRISIHRVLNAHSDWGGFDNLNNFTFEYVEEKIKTFYGTNELKAYNDDGEVVPADISQVILKGFPSNIMDVIEAWFDEKPKRATECENELNDILTIHNSPWRVIKGQIILIDSEYLHREVHAKTTQLLEECEIHGALEEYQEALNDLTSGETKDAVVNAHKSVESVMKAVLDTDESRTFGGLLNMLIKSGIIPKYYEEFLTHFEKLALGAVKERNLPARGHGQGKKPTDVAPSLAEFAVNLAGSINVFIIKHWLEVRQLETQEVNNIDVEDLPF